MNYRYQCIEQKLYNENVGEYIIYGIEITDDNIRYYDLNSEGWRSFIPVNDVSCNKEKVDDIVRIINKYQVSPIHLDEIIEDLLIA